MKQLYKTLLIILLVTSTIQASEVTGFTLVHATTDEELFQIEDGETINLNDLPGRYLDVKVETIGGAQSVKTVYYNADANISHIKRDSSYPFSACSGGSGENIYYGCASLNYNGMYTITSTPYTYQNGPFGAEAGTPKSISFTIEGSTQVAPTPLVPAAPEPTPAPTPTPKRGTYTCTILSPSTHAGPCNARIAHTVSRNCDDSSGTHYGVYRYYYGGTSRYDEYEYRVYCP